MSEAKEKVHNIEDYKKQDVTAADESLSREIMDKTNRDMGKVAMFISILSVLLLVVFFFGLNQNIAGLSQEVKALSSLKQDVQALGGRLLNVQGDVDGLQGEMRIVSGKVTELEKLPAKTRNMIITNDLSAMGEKLGYIGDQIDADQAQKLKQAQDIIKQLQSDLAK